MLLDHIDASNEGFYNTGHKSFAQAAEKVFTENAIYIQYREFMSHEDVAAMFRKHRKGIHFASQRIAKVTFAFILFRGWPARKSFNIHIR